MNEHLTEQELIDYQFKLASEPDRNEIHNHLAQCEPCRQQLEKLVRKFAALDLLRDEVKASEGLRSKTVEKAVQARRGRTIWLYRVPALGAVAAAVIAGAALLLVSNSGQDNRITPTTAPDAPAQNAVPAPAREEEYVLGKDQSTSLVAEGTGKVEPAAPSKPSSLKMALTEAQSAATSEATGRVGLAPPEPLSAPGGSVKAEGSVRSVPARASEERVEGVPPSNRGQDARDTTPYGVTTNASDAATRKVQAADIAEPPPFAPASAIELVVLPRRENVRLTIYNGADLTLVRERRNLTLKRGWNWLQFMWANTLIDPTSLSLEPLEHQDAVQVQQLVFPPRLRELGRWLIRSEVGGQVPFELTYFTSGLAWRAFYMGTLAQDEKTMRLEAYVRINNKSGEGYEDAQTRLLVGQVHLLDRIADLAKRLHPYSNESRMRYEAGVDKDVQDLRDLARDADRLGIEFYDRSRRKEIRKEGLSEYFLYTIEGTETIPNQWGKRLLSFQTDEIPVTSLYKYDEERWGTGTIRFLSFANDKEHKLGETPMPDGTVRVYGRADGEGHLSYVGAMNVKYIPVGEKVELNLGPARLVEVKPILMDSRTENHTFDDKGNVSGWDDVQTWRMEIANTRPLPVEVEVTRGFGTPAWTLKPANEEVSYEKYDATHAHFKVAVEPRSKRVFEYTVTMYHGARREVLSDVR
jgi:hypothetical protein